MASAASSIPSPTLTSVGPLPPAAAAGGSTTTTDAPPGNAAPNLSVLKEGVTTALALSIAFVSLYMLWITFQTATSGGSDDKLFTAHKDILLYGLSLFGTVLGYYFGRVPAELHAQEATARADKAQGQISQAQTTATNAVTSLQQNKQNVRDLLTTVKQNLLQAGNAPISTLIAAPQPTGLQQALAEIDAALKVT